MFDDIRWLTEPPPAVESDADKMRVDRIKKGEQFSEFLADERYPMLDLIRERIKTDIKYFLNIESDEMAKKMRWEINLLLQLLFAPEAFVEDGKKALKEAEESQKMKQD